MPKKIAVVIFNLGGPDSLDSVQPFLFNLFNDPHIIPLPQPFRYLLAKTISFFRSDKSKNIYKQMDGRSTILPETQNQAQELERYLNNNCSMDGSLKYDVIPMMRYWYPMTDEIISLVQKGNYDSVVLLPLYPHFSSTTTLSSFREWFKKAKSMLPTTLVCCYYNHPGFIDANVALLEKTLEEIQGSKTIRVLFSAHSIPQRLSDKGDPYQHQIEESVKAIVEKARLNELDNVKYTICYQSKVGRMKWLEPDIKSELLAAGERNETVVVLPISFTSEHSETLVELDIEYAELAKEKQIEFYRVPTLRTHPLFIKTLATLSVKAMEKLYPGLVDASNIKPYETTKLQSWCGVEMCCQRVKINAY